MNNVSYLGLASRSVAKNKCWCTVIGISCCTTLSPEFRNPRWRRKLTSLRCRERQGAMGWGAGRLRTCEQGDPDHRQGMMRSVKRNQSRTWVEDTRIESCRAWRWQQGTQAERTACSPEVQGLQSPSAGKPKLRNRERGLRTSREQCFHMQVCGDELLGVPVWGPDEEL